MQIQCRTPKIDPQTVRKEKTNGRYIGLTDEEDDDLINTIQNTNDEDSPNKPVRVKYNPAQAIH